MPELIDRQSALSVCKEYCRAEIRHRMKEFIRLYKGGS